MNNTIKLDTANLNIAASQSGVSPEVYISQIVKISCGRKMCAHFDHAEDGGNTSVYFLTK